MGTAASTISETNSFVGVAISPQRVVYMIDKEAVERSHRIEKELARAKQDELRTVKLLLLGGSESGKSTFAKQMRVLHMNGFTESDLANFRFLIYSNIALAVDQILRALSDLRIGTSSLAKEDVSRFVTAAGGASSLNLDLSPELGRVVKRIWTSKAAQDCYQRRSEFDLLDSAKYFFDEIERIADKHYTPTTQDILRSRAATVGIYEICFHFKGYFFKMVDVGGQKTERRKWIHCFDNVTAIMFVTALSDFDQYLAEDKTVNRMHDSLALFKSIANNSYFTKTSVLLFLNKKDIFFEKLQTSSLKDCFHNYGGTNKYEEASEYILKEFLKRKPTAKPLYSHFTVATDTKNVDVVFAACIDTIMKKTLTNVGVY